MRRNFRIALTALMGVMVLALVASVNFAPITAQGVEPTPTPSDPVWRAFVTVRSAIEEEKSVDLTIVRNYTWAQSEWPTSIDTCKDDVPVIDQRPVYFGWDFAITDLNGTVHYARVSFDLGAVVVCDRQETASSGGDGDGSDTGDLDAPIIGGGVTGGFELGGHVSSLTGEAVTAMQQSGMKWMKKQLRYTPGMGTSQAAGYLQQATDNGFNLLLGIVGSPAELGGNFEGYTDQFAGFLGEVAGLGVHAIEVWNEPNIDREWPAGQISGGNYTRMLAKAFNSIKAANPNTIVISGAPAPTGFFGEAGCTDAGCNDDAFMDQMAAAGAGQYMDCIGLHYNEGIVGPGSSSGDPRGGYPTYFFGTMTARGQNRFPGKAVCYTELGYLSGEDFTTPIPGGFAWAENVTVAQHAQWLAEAAVLASQSNVRIMIVWNVNFTRWGDDPQAGYAMIRPDGSCPACNTLGQVMSGG